MNFLSLITHLMLLKIRVFYISLLASNLLLNICTVLHERHTILGLVVVTTDKILTHGTIVLILMFIKNPSKHFKETAQQDKRGYKIGID